MYDVCLLIMVVCSPEPLSSLKQRPLSNCGSDIGLPVGLEIFCWAVVATRQSSILDTGISKPSTGTRDVAQSDRTSQSTECGKRL